MSRWQTALLAIPAVVSVACLAGAVRFLVWTSTRGLDITDEGFYYIGASYPRDVTMSVTGSHFLLSPLFAAVRWNVPAYRVAGFSFTVLSAFLLAAGLDAFRRRLDPADSRSWTLVAAEAAAIATGSLLGYAGLTTSPSYNWITNWGLTLGAAALLVALAIGEADRAASIWLGMLGAALAAVFFTKFTAAVASGAVFATVMLAWPLAPFRVRARWLLATGVGFAIAVVLYFIALQSPAAWLRMFRLGLWSAATHTPLHSAGAAMRYYVDWRDDVVVAWLKDFRLVFCALAALAVAIRFAPADRWLGGRTLRPIAWAGLGFAAYLAAIHVRDYPPSLYQYDIVRLFFGWLVLLTPLALAWRGRRPASGVQLPASGSRLPASGFQLPASGSRLPAAGYRRPASGSQLPAAGYRRPAVRLAWALVVLMLFALPFCGSVGTANALQFGMRYVLAPWFALFALILGRLSAPARVRWAVPVGLAFFSVCSVVYTVKGALEAPYRLLTGLGGQTEDTPIGPGGAMLKLDPVLHAFITDVRKAADASGFKPGDDLLGFYDMPGIVFALGGRSPGLAWYTMGYSGSRTVMERGLALADRERLRHAYILQTRASTEWLQSLGPLGINFPDDYAPGGTFTIPYSWAKEEVTWWRPKSR